VGEKGKLSRNHTKEHKKRKVVRKQPGRERSEKTMPDMEALERKISEL